MRESELQSRQVTDTIIGKLGADDYVFSKSEYSFDERGMGYYNGNGEETNLTVERMECQDG